MFRWKPFPYGGTVYDLAHLHPRTVTFTQPAKGDKPERQYTVDVVFGLHCFTRGLKENEQPDEALLYSDSREVRVFDLRRYELSKRLPEIVAGLANRKCYHTGHGNFFSIELIDEAGNKVEYDIFFAVSRSSRRGVLNLFVQSAYVRDEKHANRPQKKPVVGFHIILFNTLQNRPLKPAAK
jgi:hypothetical protein